MKNQQTFTDLEYSSRKRITRREEVLDTMDSIIPWDEFVELIRPHYYKNRTGRPSNDTIVYHFLHNIYYLTCSRIAIYYIHYSFK